MRHIAVGCLVTVLLFFNSMEIHAQEEPLHFSARIHAGFSTTQVHGDRESGFNKFGLSTGATIDIRRSKSQGVQWGILYTQKGSRKVPDITQVDYETFSLRFHYLDLPLTYVHHPMPAWWWGGGLQPSVLISAKEEHNGIIYEFEGLNRIDLCGVANAGYIRSDKTAFEVRLSQSLLPIKRLPESAQSWNFMMNMAIQWMVTWRLG